MGKVLSVNDLVQADLSAIPNADILKDIIEKATEALAEIIAAHFGITCIDVSNQPGFAGLCATFVPAFKGQACPDLIDQGDEEGDWDEDDDDDEELDGEPLNPFPEDDDDDDDDADQEPGA